MTGGTFNTDLHSFLLLPSVPDRCQLRLGWKRGPGHPSFVYEQMWGAAGGRWLARFTEYVESENEQEVV